MSESKLTYRFDCQQGHGTFEQTVIYDTELICPTNPADTLTNQVIIDENTEKGYLFFRAGETISIGDWVRIGTDEKLYKACADTENNSRVIGVSVEAGNIDDIVRITAAGEVDILTGLTTGDSYYLSQTTAGAMTNTKPSSGIIVHLGIANRTTDIIIRIGRE